MKIFVLKRDFLLYPQKSKHIAIMVDGSFFRKRYFHYTRKTYDDITPKDFSKIIYKHCLKHIRRDEELYRIFYYDCNPNGVQKPHYPNSNGTRIYDPKKTKTYKFQTELYKELCNLPCLALRYGHLDPKNFSWDICNKKKEDGLKGKIKIEDLEDEDFIYTAKQKGVDIKIGIDIATLSIKGFVEKIVLITGDSDFVPAIKLARMEGVQVLLDPMGNPISEELRKNIDYLKTKLPGYKKPNTSSKS